LSKDKDDPENHIGKIRINAVWKLRQLNNLRENTSVALGLFRLNYTTYLEN